MVMIEKRVMVGRQAEIKGGSLGGGGEAGSKKGPGREVLTGVVVVLCLYGVCVRVS